MTQEIQFLSEEIENTTALNIQFPISLIFGSARRPMKFLGKKCVTIAAFEKSTSSHQLASFPFGILKWDGIYSFTWFCPETWPTWQLRAAQGTYFWGKIQSLFPVTDCFSLLFSVSSPKRESRFYLKEGCCSMFYWCWLGAVVGAFLCWACFTPDLPNEGGVSALESPFH